MKNLLALYYCTCFISIISYGGITNSENLSSSVNSETFSFDPEAPIVFHPNQYFVELDGLVPEETIAQMLLDQNSIEIWEDDNLNLAVWEVISFPFTNSNGDIILDINDAATAARKKTKIRSSALNIQQTIVSSPASAGQSCFNIADYFSIQGDESIKISILDTGISDISDNSTAEFNYNLTSYTGYDYVNNDNIPDDEHGHGTHLAGIIHSITHQSNPIDSRITYDIRKTHDSLGQGYMSAAVFALVDAIKANADIVNMSFSVNDTYHDSLFFPLQNVIEAAKEEGVLIVAAGGNDSSNNDDLTNTALPASFPSDNIITVASSDCNQSISAFSNFGASTVDLATLGENIPGPDLANGITCISGTSQAAAIISAIAALRGSQQLVFDYELIKCALINTSTHFVDLRDVVLSDGIMNFGEAMQISNIECQNISDNCNVDFIGINELTGLQTKNIIYETNLNIESSQILQLNHHVSYDALLSTSLLSGFEVQSGASFQIANDGCLN